MQILAQLQTGTETVPYHGWLDSMFGASDSEPQEQLAVTIMYSVAEYCACLLDKQVLPASHGSMGAQVTLEQCHTAAEYIEQLGTVCQYLVVMLAGQALL